MRRRECSPPRLSDRFRPRVEWLEDRATPADWGVEVNRLSDVPLAGATRLRDAIDYANTRGKSDTTNITFDATLFPVGGNTAVITLLSELPKLGRGIAYQTVNITAPAGKTVVVRRDPNLTAQFRIFNVNSTSTANLTGITAAGGRLFGGTTDPFNGGGIYVDDGSVLTLTRSTVTDCRVQGKGGGIYLTRDAVSLTMTSASVVETSQADGNGGGIYAGGRFNNWGGDHVKITQGSEVRTNTSVNGSGGGIYFDSTSGTNLDSVKIDGNSKVNGNTAKLDGGGIYIAPKAEFAGTFTDIQVNDNRSLEGRGAALFTGGKVLATRVNFQFNKGGAAAGYTIAVSAAAVAKPLDLVSSGVTNNMYMPPGGIDTTAAAVDAGNGGISFTRSVVLDNTYKGVRGVVVSGGGNTVTGNAATGWLPPPQDTVTG